MSFQEFLKNLKLWGFKTNDHNKIIDLLEEITKDLKNYELEFRIEELESKFEKDMSEKTFDEIKELKERKKSQNIN